MQAGLWLLISVVRTRRALLLGAHELAQPVILVKELTFRSNTDDRDYEFKKNHANASWA